jgi:hypothetical protein
VSDAGVVSDAGRVGSVLDELIARFGGGENAGEVARARAEYDERRGRVFEDEELWERWSQVFLEWYVLERVMPGHDYPPAATALAETTDPARAEVLRALLTSHRSLFEVRATEVGKVMLVDLLGGAELEVDEQRAMHGVEVGDVLEARLVGVRRAVSFARTFWFHPAGTRDSIVVHSERLRREGKDRREIIDYMANLRVRCERYKHLTPQKLYERPERQA